MALIYRWLWYLLPANPVLVQIVEGGSRRVRHLWVRMVYLGVLIGLVLVTLLTGGGMHAQVSLTDLAKAGTLVFTVTSYGQVLLICLLAPLFMAGAIAQEKLGRTYDILLTTPMSNLQIVLGSLFGRLFFVLALLMSGVPLFAVLLIFGGVPTGAVFVSFTVAALSAVMVGSVAVTLSVLRAGGRKAVFVFIIAVGAYLVASYCLDYFVLRRVAPVPGAGADGTTWLTPLHPLLVLEASLNNANYRPPAAEVLGGYPWWLRFYLAKPFGAFVVISVGVSGVLMVCSTVVLRRFNQNQGRAGLYGWLRRRLRLGAARRREPRAVWSNPIAWREALTRGTRAGWIIGRLAFVAVGLGGAGVLLWVYHTGRLPTVADPVRGGVLGPHDLFRLALMVLLLAELTMIVLVAVFLSAGCVSREREEGTLDLILTTPVTPRQYIWGKLRGLVSFLAVLLAVPVLTVAMVSAYASVGRWLGWGPAVVPHSTISDGVIGTMQVGLLLPEVPVLLAAALVPFVALCVMVGMTWSLKARGVLSAVTPAIGIIGCLVMVTGFCGYNAAQNVPMVGPAINAFSPVTSLGMLINPWERVVGFADDPVTGRMSLAVSALVACGGYSLVVYLMLLTMVNTFDQAVRRLSGEG